MSLTRFATRAGWPLLALLAVAGCDAQATPTYTGQVLLSLSGSIELESTRERGELAPALAFYNSETGSYHVMDVAFEGQFPADFTLRVYEPPPPEAIVESDDRPASAVAYLTAVTADHPDVIRGANFGGGGTTCPVSPDIPGQCRIDQTWCARADDCYREVRECPAVDSPPEDCTIVEQSGDPALREDPWAEFAGLSETHMILYLPHAVPADDPALLRLGLPGLNAGYHLMENPSEEDRQAYEACRDQAAADATAEYNAVNDTDFENLGGGFECAPQEAIDPQAGSGDAPSDHDTSEEPVECNEPDWMQYEALEDAALLDRDCYRLSAPKLIDDPAHERISVRIGANVRPGW